MVNYLWKTMKEHVNVEGSHIIIWRSPWNKRSWGGVAAIYYSWRESWRRSKFGKATTKCPNLQIPAVKAHKCISINPWRGTLLALSTLLARHCFCSIGEKTVSKSSTSKLRWLNAWYGNRQTKRDHYPTQWEIAREDENVIWWCV